MRIGVVLATMLVVATASAEDRRIVHGEITARGNLALSLAPDPGSALGGGATLGVALEPVPWMTLAVRWRIAHYATLDEAHRSSVSYGRTSPYEFSLTVLGPELAVGVQLPVVVGDAAPFARAIVGLDLAGTCARYINSGCGGLGALVGGEVGAIWSVDRNVAFTASAELLSFFAAYVDPGLLVGLALGVLVG